jgi:uncharacterized protein YjiK
MPPRTLLAAAAAALVSTAWLAPAAIAAPALQLQNYRLTGNYALDNFNRTDGRGLEASAVTYARDRGTLFFVGDEGKGVVEISRTGQTLGTMSFNWAGTASTNQDTEGLTYLGGGVLVVAEERLQDVYRFNYTSGGTVAMATAPQASIGATVGNVGTEGISFDPRNGSFVSVKQDNPVQLLAGNINFAVGGGASSMAVLLSGATSLLGVNSFSDVQTLSPVDALVGTAAADHLLVLSLDSRRLLEITRAGVVVSSLDLAGFTSQAIEGVTVDEKGTIYLVAEDSGTANSRLLVLSAVPETSTLGMAMAGLALLWGKARFNKRSALP